MKIQELKEELNSVLKGKTLDTILPPLIFFMTNQFLTLSQAVIISLAFAVLLMIYRVFRKNSILYSVFGFLGTAFAALFSYLMGNVNDYFLPGIIGSVLLVLITLISIIIKRPLPLLLSHLTRGWTFEWFLRKDIFPAYFEAGLLWLTYFTLRAGVQVFFYVTDNARGLTLMSTALGFPITILVLILTYIYGIYRLNKLGGPGIEEFDEHKKPPYKGQTRGF